MATTLTPLQNFQKALRVCAYTTTATAGDTITLPAPGMNRTIGGFFLPNNAGATFAGITVNSTFTTATVGSGPNGTAGTIYFIGT